MKKQINWVMAAILCGMTMVSCFSPEYHVLVATNYSASEYPPFRGFLNVGDIHSCEPWLYSQFLFAKIAIIPE